MSVSASRNSPNNCESPAWTACPSPQNQLLARSRAEPRSDRNSQTTTGCQSNLPRHERYDDDDDDVCPRNPHYAWMVSQSSRPFSFPSSYTHCRYPSTAERARMVFLCSRPHSLLFSGGAANCTLHVDMRGTKWEQTTCQRCTMIHLEPDAINSCSLRMAGTDSLVICATRPTQMDR